MNPKRRVFVYGNCQGGWLAQTLHQQPIVAEQFEIVYLASFGEHPSDHPLHQPDFLAGCSVVIWQTAPGIQPPDFLGGLPASCRQIRFPTLWLKLLWPLNAGDPRNAPEPGFPYGRYPYGDRLVMKLLEEGVSLADLPKRYVDTDLNTIVNLDRFAEMSFAELRFNDKQSDIAITSFIENTFRQKKLFGTLNHPTFAILHRIYCAVISSLLDQPACDDPPLPANATDILGEIEIPFHPQIVEHFKLQWALPGARFRYNSAFLSLEEYLQAYGAFLPIPIGNSPRLWLARAEQAAGQNDLGEAQRLLLEGASLFPSRVEFLHQLGALLLRQENLIEAEKVFRYAVTQHKNSAPLHHELGRVLLQRGFPDQATAEFKQALQIEPTHKDARRHLILAAGQKTRPASAPGAIQAVTLHGQGFGRRGS